MARVLVVEPDPDLMSLICLLLSDCGHECFEHDPEAPGAGPRDAVERLRPDVLVVGVASPMGHRESRAGLRLLDQLDGTLARLPVVAYSLSSDQSLAPTLRKRGLILWHRPFDNMVELCELVEEAARKGQGGVAGR